MQFKDIKPGDVVLRYHEKSIIDGGWGTGLTVRVVIEETVARVTAKQAVTETGLRFTLNDGTIIGMGNGVRVLMYPVGYVDPYARNALDARPLAATSIARLAELDSAATESRSLMHAMNRFGMSDRKIIKHVLQEHGMAKGSEMLAEVAASIKALMKGFKP